MPPQARGKGGNMRRTVPVFLICASLAACSDKPADPRGVERDEVLLQVSASGRTDSRPNEARFTAGVETIESSAPSASAGNSRKMNAVVEALQKLGIRDDDLQTQRITMQRIDYRPNQGRFQAHNIVEIRVRDIRRAGEAIAAATGAGANVLSGPNLTVSDPEAASRSAYAQAYKAARARAEAYAQAAGLQVARVLVIRDEGGGGPMPYAYDANMSVRAESGPVSPPPPPMRPGMTTSEVRVRADFALTKD
jgi:uncharacterized protein YggE